MQFSDLSLCIISIMLTLERSPHGLTLALLHFPVSHLGILFAMMFIEL